MLVSLLDFELSILMAIVMHSRPFIVWLGTIKLFNINMNINGSLVATHYVKVA